MESKEEGFFDFLLGYRKTLAWVGLFVVSTVLLLKGYLTGAQWTDAAKATFLGFIGGNLGEHLGNLSQVYFKSKGPISTIITEVEKKVENVSST